MHGIELEAHEGQPGGAVKCLLAFARGVARSANRVTALWLPITFLAACTQYLGSILGRLHLAQLMSKSGAFKLLLSWI
jgi:hypothetical protein